MVKKFNLKKIVANDSTSYNSPWNRKILNTTKYYKIKQKVYSNMHYGIILCKLIKNKITNICIFFHCMLSVENCGCKGKHIWLIDRTKQAWIHQCSPWS